MILNLRGILMSLSGAALDHEVTAEEILEHCDYAKGVIEMTNFLVDEPLLSELKQELQIFGNELHKHME